MALETVELDAGSGGAVINVDTINGESIPVSKIIIGADGTNDGLVSSANPLPVTLSGVATAANQTTIIGHVDGIETVLGTIDTDTGAIATSAASIDGKITACNTGAVVVSSSALPTGAATAANQTTANGHLSTLAGTDFATGTDVAALAVVGGGAEATALRVTIASDSTGVLTVDGTVTAELSAVDNAVLDAIAASVAGTLAVSGTVTANAGTNLNTSALALESGGNLATAATLLGTIDADTGGIATSTASIDGKITVCNTGAVTVSAALPAGDNNIGNVDLASAIPAGTNTVGNVGLSKRTSGGLSIFKSVDIDESEEQVKGTAGQVYGIYVVNTNASARYLKVYNATAANVTVGSTATVMDLYVPPDSSGFFVKFEHGIEFDTAITVAATTGVGDSDSGAPGANEVQVHVWYA